jgi:hypothetical protein
VSHVRHMIPCLAVLAAAIVVVTVTGVPAGSLLVFGVVALCPLVMAGGMWWMGRAAAGHAAGTTTPEGSSTDAELGGTRR